MSFVLNIAFFFSKLQKIYNVPFCPQIKKKKRLYKNFNKTKISQQILKKKKKKKKPWVLGGPLTHGHYEDPWQLLRVFHHFFNFLLKVFLLFENIINF
jgi:hypothetical protein